MSLDKKVVGGKSNSSSLENSGAWSSAISALSLIGNPSIRRCNEKLQSANLKLAGRPKLKASRQDRDGFENLSLVFSGAWRLAFGAFPMSAVRRHRREYFELQRIPRAATPQAISQARLRDDEDDIDFFVLIRTQTTPGEFHLSSIQPRWVLLIAP